MLEALRKPEPRLWLETVNADFEAPVSNDGWELAVLSHAMRKAMRGMVPLFVADLELMHTERKLAPQRYCLYDSCREKNRT